MMISEALEAGITDYNSFCIYKDKYYKRATASGSVADMEQERLLFRIMNGTHYYRVQTLERFMEAALACALRACSPQAAERGIVEK